MNRLRRTTAITAVLTLSVAVPAIPAEAASGSVTITAIDRSGQAASLNAEVINLKTFALYSLQTGKAHKLPNGRYAVAASIDTGPPLQPGSSQTLVGKVVTVVGHALKVQLDARGGRKLSITPNFANPAFFAYEADICAAGEAIQGLAEFYGVDNYVVPSTARELQFVYGASWANSVNGPFYNVAARTAHGVPANLGFSYVRASFAKLSIKVLKGNVKSGGTTLMMQDYAGTGCAASSTSWGQFSAPRTVVSYLSTGTWQPFITYRDNQGYTPGPVRNYVAGHHYSLTMNRTA